MTEHTLPTTSLPFPCKAITSSALFIGLLSVLILLQVGIVPILSILLPLLIVRIWIILLPVGIVSILVIRLPVGIARTVLIILLPVGSVSILVIRWPVGIAGIVLIILLPVGSVLILVILWPALIVLLPIRVAILQTSICDKWLATSEHTNVPAVPAVVRRCTSRTP